MSESVSSNKVLLLYFPLQYQNVFAPLIKLEADYDKVCVMILVSFGFYSSLDSPPLLYPFLRSQES